MTTQVTVDSRKGRPYPKPCKLCGHMFTTTETFYVETTKIDWFRGNDVVEFRCYPECKKEGDK